MTVCRSLYDSLLSQVDGMDFEYDGLEKFYEPLVEEILEEMPL